MLVQGEGPIPARIMIVGEAPGIDEERSGHPFVGVSGQELDRMLHEAGIMRNECFVTNLCRQRPPGNDIENYIPSKKKDVTADMVLLRDRYVKPIVREGYELLKKEIDIVKPNIIIALGNTAMWALTGNWGITSWRGSVLETSSKIKVLPTYHPAAILRMWEWRFITVHDLRRAKSESAFPEVRYPPYNFLLRPTFQEVVTVLETLLDEVAIAERDLAVDIETRRGFTACIGIAWSRLEAICIPLMCTEKPEGYFTFDEELAIILLLRRLLTHPRANIIGQNFIYDSQYIFNEWLCIPHTTFDTMLMHHVCFSGLPKGLHFLSSLYCDFHRYWKNEGKEWDPSMPEERLWRYNCVDAVTTFECKQEISRTIEQMGLQQAAATQQSLFFPVLKMMLRGVRINAAARPEVSRELSSGIIEREQFLERVLGHPLNPRSPKQMQALFYHDFNLKPVLNRKTRQPSLDDEAIQKLRVREPLLIPIFTAISDIRTLNVFRSTFVESESDPDGRMRTSFNIAGTETFRFSSSTNAYGRGMNLENIPSETSKSIQKAKQRGSTFDLPNIRKLFIPDPGYTFFDLDLDRADLQVVVWESDDRELKELLRRGDDIHSANAAVLGIHRELAKIFCHGTNYGGSAATMAAHCGISVHQADQMQKRWFGAHPGIRDWHRRTEEQLMTRRYVENKFGYRRFYFGRVEALLPEALAWIPQSTVAITINKALVNIDSTLPEVQILLQVHDSLAGQFPTSQPHLAQSILDAACIPIPYEDPLTISRGIKLSTESWGACKKAA